MLEISRGSISKYCAQSICLIASFVPFEHTREFIRQILKIDVSQTAIEHLSHRIGLKMYHNVWEKGRMPYKLSCSSKHVNKLYIQMDGAMVPLCGDKKVEHRENKLAVLYTDRDVVQLKQQNGEDKFKIKRKKYVSSLAEGVEKFRKMLHAVSIEKGAKIAKEIVILGDGAPWISKIKEDYYPEATFILDWYHATEKLWVTARELFRDNTQKCREWVEPLESLLWDGKVDQLIKEITKQAMKRKKNQTPLFSLRTYYMNNKDNMNYPEYRRKGYNIGSGAIESANKYIVAQRLKLSGMQWTSSHANAIIHLRSKYFENNWDKFWEDMKMSDYYNHNLVEKYRKEAA